MKTFVRFYGWISVALSCNFWTDLDELGTKIFYSVVVRLGRYRLGLLPIKAMKAHGHDFTSLPHLGRRRKIWWFPTLKNKINKSCYDQNQRGRCRALNLIVSSFLWYKFKYKPLRCRVFDSETDGMTDGLMIGGQMGTQGEWNRRHS